MRHRLRCLLCLQILRPAKTVAARSPTRQTGAINIRSPIVRIAVRATRSSVRRRTTGGRLRWISFRCARPASANSTILPTGGFTPNPTPARCAGRSTGWWTGRGLRCRWKVVRLFSVKQGSCCSRERYWQSRGWAGFIWPVMQKTKPPWRRCVSEKSVKINRLPSWPVRWQRSGNAALFRLPNRNCWPVQCGQSCCWTRRWPMTWRTAWRREIRESV